MFLRTVLEKVLCFGTPRTAWYQRGWFTGNIKYKLAFLSQPVFSGTKAKLQTCLPKIDWKASWSNTNLPSPLATDTLIRPLWACVPPYILLHVHIVPMFSLNPCDDYRAFIIWNRNLVPLIEGLCSSTTLCPHPLSFLDLLFPSHLLSEALRRRALLGLPLRHHSITSRHLCVTTAGHS